MPQAFSCPNCGGVVETVGTDPTVPCKFCGTNVIVPETLRQTSASPKRVLSPQESKQLGRWIIIFIVVTVVGPTLLGLIFGGFGLCVSILAPLLAILASLFVK